MAESIFIPGVGSQVFTYKAPVRAASTANIAALTGLLVIDGVVLIAGDRVLVKNQAAGADNGIYVVAAGAWTRSLDFDDASTVVPGSVIPVTEGATQADTVWLLATDGPIIVGVTVLSFVQLGATGGGELVNTVSTNLSVDFTTTAQPPVYTTLHTLPITTVNVSSYLFILWTGSVLMSGPSALNTAPTFRFRLNGVLLSPGNGITVNTVRALIQPIAYSRRIVVAAGLQTVIVEAAYFGPAGQTLAISPLTLPDLMHSHLMLQEQAS